MYAHLLNVAKCLPLALFTLLPTGSLAGWISRAGVSLPNSANQKAIGSFGASLIFVPDEDELFKQWATPSESVNVRTTDKVRVNEPISAFVVFGGCKADKEGNCSVVMRFRVVRPDGKVYVDSPPMDVWSGQPAPPGRSLELSVAYLKLIIEPKDQLGKYVISAQVMDNNSGTVLQLSGPFNVVNAK